MSAARARDPEELLEERVGRAGRGAARPPDRSTSGGGDRRRGGSAPAVAEQLEALLGEEAALLSAASRELLRARLLRETVGLGPLEELLGDPEVEEVLVNGHDEVWIERAGRLERRDSAFESEAQLHDVVERILGPLGRRVDELSPIADGRLDDGSRVNVIIPPLAIDGVTISIRRFAALRPGPEELIERGSVPAELMDLLRADVEARRSILISGGTGSGKTTLLNALSAFIAAGERVITIEDAAELRLCQPHVVRLESRPAGLGGAGAVTIRDLVRNALRMRPDRLIIGEVRGAEAMDLIVALNTGHAGRAFDGARERAGRGPAPGRDARADVRPAGRCRGRARAACGRARPGRPRQSPAGRRPGGRVLLWRSRVTPTPRSCASSGGGRRWRG